MILYIIVGLLTGLGIFGWIVWKDNIQPENSDLLTMTFLLSVFGGFIWPLMIIYGVLPLFCRILSLFCRWFSSLILSIKDIYKSII